MFRLRKPLLSAVSAAASLRRPFLFSTTAASPARFVAEDFLVTTCGLTAARALRASRYIAHHKSSTNAEAVLAFLADSGLAKADVATVIARDPQLLRSSVENTLKPCLGLLCDIGISAPQISSLVTTYPRVLGNRRMIPRLEFYLSFLGSFDKVHTALKRNTYLLSPDIERLVRPNIAFLQECGLIDRDIIKLFWISPRMVLLNLERVKEIVVCADKLGVPRDSAMFKHALVSIYRTGPGRIQGKLDLLKKVLGCSEAELGIAVRKLPAVLYLSEDRLSNCLKFLKTEVGLEIRFIVHRPALFTYGLKSRLMPRYHVLKILKANGLIKQFNFYGAVSQIEKKFVKRFIDPYKENVPGLADSYAAACAGQTSSCNPTIRT